MAQTPTNKVENLPRSPLVAKTKWACGLILMMILLIFTAFFSPIEGGDSNFPRPVFTKNTTPPSARASSFSPSPPSPTPLQEHNSPTVLNQTPTPAPKHPLLWTQKPRSHFPVDVHFPHNLRFQSSSTKNLPSELLEKIRPFLNWPSGLKKQHLYPHLSDRSLPGLKPELFVQYEIKVQGFSLPQSYVRVLLFETQKNQFQIGFINQNLIPPPTRSFAVRISKKEALQRAQSLEGTTSPAWQMSEVWHRSKTTATGPWAPSWKVQLQGGKKIYFVNVESGSVTSEEAALGAQEDRILVEGRALGLLAPPDKTSLLPLPKIKVWGANGKIYETDESGFLSLPHKDIEFDKISLDTDLLQIKDESLKGGHLDHLFNTTNPPSSLIVNPFDNPKQTAQLNTFIYFHLARNFLLQDLGFKLNPVKRRPVVAHVNIESEICNAQYMNGSFNFDSESAECRNTAYDTIIFHEFAHLIDETYGGILDRALSEGLGDVLSSFLSNQPIVGKGLFKQFDAYLRSTENTMFYNGDPQLLQNADVMYENGQAFAGFAWQARTALLQKYGFIRGKQVSDYLFLTPLETNAPNIPAAVAEIFARSAQGEDIETSPDFELLQKAAAQHGVDWAPPTPAKVNETL